MMLIITVQYPSSSTGFTEGDLQVLRTFDDTIARHSVALFASTLNPAWVVESGEYTSPLCCLKIGQCEVLRRTVAELRTMTEDGFHNALVEASFAQDRG